jgi:hypothetical protein
MYFLYWAHPARAPDRAFRLYLLPHSPKRAKGYRFNPLRLAVGAWYIEPKLRAKRVLEQALFL